MGIINFPSALEVTSVVDNIRSAIGRVADFFGIASVVECTECILDPITETSTNSFCLTCSGLYYITTYSGTTISGHVWWKAADLMHWPNGGQYFDGDATFQLKYNLENMTTVNNTEYLMLDGKRMSIEQKVVRGVPELNRIILSLKEEERNST